MKSYGRNIFYSDILKRILFLLVIAAAAAGLFFAGAVSAKADGTGKVVVDDAAGLLAQQRLHAGAGFKYYVDDKKIIDAYYKTLYKQKIKYKTPTKKNRKNKTQEAQQNEAVKLNEDNAPTFTFNPPSIGFSSILKRK